MRSPLPFQSIMQLAAQNRIVMLKAVHQQALRLGTVRYRKALEDAGYNHLGLMSNSALTRFLATLATMT